MTPRRALLVALAAVGCAAVCVLVDDPVALRAPFGLLLLLVLPGAALSRAIFPGGRRDHVQDAALTVGLSLAVAVIGGADMGAAGLLSVESWAAYSAAVTVIAGGVAAWRAARLAPAPSVARRARRPWRAAGAVAAAVLALVVVGGAVALARTPLSVPDDRGYTVMTIGTGADAGTLDIGLASEEAHERSFSLVLSMDEKREERPVTLAPGQRMTIPVSLDGWPRFGTFVAELVDPDGPRNGVYRRVRMRLPSLLPATPVDSPDGTWGEP